MDVDQEFRLAHGGLACVDRIDLRLQWRVLRTAECLRFHGSVRSVPVHPGWADTPAVRTSLPRFWNVMRRVLRTPAEGSDTVVWLAASTAARGQSGRFWFDRQARSTHLLPWTRERLKDRQALRRLCERLTG